MYAQLIKNIEKFQDFRTITSAREKALEPLVVYMKQKIKNNQPVNLNFICTHNSRRSHLAQVWAQVAAAYYHIEKVHCYSGGTEETSLFFKIVETLETQGFQITKMKGSSNPIHAIKYDDNSLPIIAFSKKYDDAFNPTSEYAAIMTCSQANSGCPFIAGAQQQIPITYEDPKISDGTKQQNKVYEKASIEIATEMMFVFSKITN